MPAEEAAQFLADSPDRQRLLRHLVESSGSPADLAENLSLSRRSVQRHLSQFADREWARKTDGHYELTVTGELIVEEHEGYLETLGRIDDLAEFFGHLPDREHTPDPRWLDTATVATASPENPQAPVQHYLNQVRSFETDHIRMISPVLSRLFQKAHAQLALQGVHTDLVMDSQTIDRAKELNPREFDISSSIDVLDIYRYPDDFAFGLTIGDEQVLMGAYDDDGQLRASVGSTESQFIEWSRQLFEGYRDRAELVEPALQLPFSLGNRD
jgi:predicted transcriptional regulator